MQHTTRYEKFVDEYGSDDAVCKYTTGTAGYGIAHLLNNDYPTGRWHSSFQWHSGERSVSFATTTFPEAICSALQRLI